MSRARVVVRGAWFVVRRTCRCSGVVVIENRRISFIIIRLFNANNPWPGEKLVRGKLESELGLDRLGLPARQPGCRAGHVLVLKLRNYN